MAGAQRSSSPSAVHDVGLGIDRDARQRVVELHVALADAAAAADRDSRFAQAERATGPRSSARLRDERQRRRAGRAAERAEHRPHASGCGVGIDALASPICAHAMKPPLITSSGLTPKKAGLHSTRSASLPTSTDPTSCAMPCAMAGLIVYFAM